MSVLRLFLGLSMLLSMLIPGAAYAEPGRPTTEERPDHLESAHGEGRSPADLPETPTLPSGMTLDDVLDRAAEPPPPEYPNVIPDDKLRFFLLAEQFEYRIQPEATDELGWEGQAWVGYDYNKLWVKTEGESIFEGTDRGESEWDFLYSRLVTAFWNAQAGVQYANEWESRKYDDRWSGVIALQGLTPGLVEMDASLYVSDEGDFTAALEGEYNIRFTQRLVLQPRVELGFAAQDVSDRGLGAGMTDGNFDLRLRYEVRREVAPYIGARYRLLVGETADRARNEGGDEDDFFFLVGIRLAY